MANRGKAGPVGRRKIPRCKRAERCHAKWKTLVLTLIGDTPLIVHRWDPQKYLVIH